MTYHYKREFLEDFATVWRAIGQPKTDGLFLLMAIDTPVFEYLPRDWFGLTVVEVDSLPDGKHLMLGFPFDEYDATLSDAFDAEWQKVRKKYARENPFQ